MIQRLFFSLFALIFLCINLAPYPTDAAEMEDYCVVPPYIIQNIPPNVMIIIDNSGSMFSLAYSDGFNTTDTGDDNSCANSGSPCTGFENPGIYPDYKYYGYFNPDYWYMYSSGRFVQAAPKSGSGLAGARGKLDSEWDGNFLNWVTMRRIDVVRKVMTGGKITTGEGIGYDRLLGEVADCDSRGKYRTISNSGLYTPYSGNRKILVNTMGGACDGGGSGTSSFSLRNDSSGGDGTGNENTWNVAVRVPTPVEGVLQRVVGARARIGLTFYKPNEGGYVQVYVSGGSLASTVNQINLTRPNANTPMGETVWTTTGYFAQQASIAGGPGPRYTAGDYQINNNVDAFNYGTGGQARYPTCAKSFVLLLTDGEPCSDGNLPGTIANYASGRSDFNCSDGSCPALSGTSPENYSFTSSTFSSCGAGGYVAGIEDVALYMHTTDLRSATLGSNNINGTQNLTLFNVFAFGSDSTLLKYASINGGFEDLDGSNTPNDQSEWDNNNDGEPDTYYEARDGAQLESKLEDAFQSILKRASSGTAASVLASGEGQGANLIQAVFYPRRRFGNDIIEWNGLLQNLWYHVDPFFSNSNIIEDTVQDSILNLSDDYIVQLEFDTELDRTVANLYEDTNADGAPDSLTPVETRSFEDLNYLWEAGKLLWARNLSTTPRRIYTTVNGSTFLTNGPDDWGFDDNNAATLAPYLNVTDTDGDGSVTDDAENIINYIHGIDIIQDANADGLNDYRERTVVIDDVSNVWKLGDILNSTPRIASWIKLHNHDELLKYNDATYKAFIESSVYTDRGMVYAGGNDGMLHAFRLGKLELNWSGRTTSQKARITGTDPGKEEWAFIPKNALPYLKYIAEQDYCHIYSVDLSPYIFDSSIGAPGSGDISGSTKPDDGSTWRTILIGGMKTGGACASTTTTTATRPDVDGDGSKDFVNTPVDVSGISVGYSSYFALDVTDEDNPQLLWEFSNPQLGFTSTGPSVIRLGPGTENGKWYVVFGSGPTGPINTADLQFMGRSDQNLRFFVLDLKTGNLLRTIDTAIQYAFAGSLLNSTNDSDKNYQDDAVYVGYVKRTSSSPYTWTNGGVGRLVTKEDPNPDNWVWSTVLDNIGPVTSSIARLQKNEGCLTDSNKSGCLWLFFGTGRYYYAQETAIDDQNGQRTIYGIKEPCVTPAGERIAIDTTCTSAVTGLTNVTAIADVPTISDANNYDFKGWYINLDASSSGYGAERVITDPLGVTTGLVFFTTSKPYTDVCAIGGKTHIWALRYNTGGSATALLKGTALIQVSTAAIEQINLAEAFSEKDGRRSSGMEGLPPTQQGLSIMTQPPPIKRTMHIRER